MSNTKLATEKQVRDVVDTFSELYNHQGKQIKGLESGIIDSISPDSISPEVKGMYSVTSPGIFINFKDINGNPIEITSEEYGSALVFIVFNGISCEKRIIYIEANGKVEEGELRAVSGGEVWGKQKIFNVNYELNTVREYTVMEAVSLVPVSSRIRGGIVCFKGYGGVYEVWQYKGVSDRNDNLAGWLNRDMWQNIDPYTFLFETRTTDPDDYSRNLRFDQYGVAVESTAGHITNYVDVQDSESITFTAECGVQTAALVGYDSNKNQITILRYSTASPGNEFDNEIVSIPSDVKYVRGWGRVAPNNPELQLSISYKAFKYNTVAPIWSSKKKYIVGSPEVITTPVQALGVTPSYELDALYAIYDKMIVDYPNYVTKRVLGQDDFGNDLFEYAFKYKNPVLMNPDWVEIPFNEEIKNPTLLITSGIHGNEKGASVATAEALKLICEGTLSGVNFIKNNVTIKVIPCVNPSGYKLGTRDNGNGINLNRDYTDKTQPETIIVCDFIDNNIGAIGMLDSHSTHALRYALSIKQDEFDLFQIVLSVGGALYSDWSSVLPPQDAPYISILTATVDTMKDYMYKRGIKGVTIEVPNEFTYPSRTDSSIKCSVDIHLNLMATFINNS